MGTDSKESKSPNRDVCTSIFTAVLVTAAKNEINLDAHQHINNEKNVGHAHKGICVSIKQNHDFCRKMDRTRNHWIKGNKPNSETQILHVF